MILATHAFVGAAIAQAIPQYPAIGFLAAFASHFVLDTIPHWEYSIEIESYTGINSKKILIQRIARDILKVLCDAQIGVLAVLLILWNGTAESLLPLALGMFGGILPDILHAITLIISWKPLNALQQFHKKIHTKIIWKDRFYAGTITQVSVSIVVIALIKLL